MNSKIICGPKKNYLLPKQSLGKTFYEHLQKVDKNFIAFINADHTNEFLTYGNVLEFSKNLAINLRNFGIKINDVIGIVADNSIYYCLPVLAGFYLGATVHLINSNCTQYELRHLLKISKPKIVFCSKCSLEDVKLLRNEFSIEKLIILDDNGNYFEDVISFQNLIENIDSNSFELANDVDPKEHVALVINSSGSTGLPKGVMLTHESISIILISKVSGGIQSTGICTLPLSHSYGFFTAARYLICSEKLILMNKFKTELFFEIIQDFQIKELLLVPTLINLLATTPKTEQYNLSSVEDIVSGSAPLPTSLLEIFTKKFNLKNFYHYYGSSECGPMALSRSKYNSSFSGGKLLPCKLLKICDLNTNETLGVKEVGEICIKGGIFKGYMNDEEKTRQAIDDEGFFHTGDFGYYDEKGQLYLTDRIKDVIKYKSYHFSPTEVEDILLRHSAVKDVAIVGKPDNHAGELPVAFIVKKAGAIVEENDIISYVAKFFSKQKQLHGGVRFIERIPRNAMGKILRIDLKESLLHN